MFSADFVFAAGDHIVTVGKEEDIRRLTSKS
jgi:K+/H+ antiporter YhaU regulatory subunit KhtT